MRLTHRRGQSCTPGRFCFGLIFCVLALVLLGGISVAGEIMDISDLPSLRRDLGARLPAPECVKTARIRTLQPLPGTVSLEQRRLDAMDMATKGMTRSDVTAGPLPKCRRNPVVYHLVRPELPLFDENKEPDSTVLKGSASKCKDCKSCKKCACRGK